MTTLFTLIGLFLGLILSARSIHQRLQRLRSELQSAWLEVDRQLRRRYEVAGRLLQGGPDCSALDPAHLERMSQGLSAAMHLASPREKAPAEIRFQQALQAWLTQSGLSPQAAPSSPLAPLRRQLQEIENELETAVENYNTIVRDYNATISYFPSHIIASHFHFVAAEAFPLDTMGSEGKAQKLSI